MNIAVAHIAGGDLVVGNVDDSVRHAVTRLAHLHFPFSAESAARLQRMGEEPWRIHAVGNPALDRYGLVKPLTREELSDHLAFDVTEGPLLLVLQHTISSEFEAAGAQMRETMEAIADLGFRTVVSYPNSDAGSREMIRVIEEFAAKLPFIRVFRSLPRVDFVNLVRVVDVLVGNSSMGLLEAPFLRLPAVNIGNRQMSRQHADNVIFVPHERDAVKQAIRTALNDRSFRAKLETSQHLFGDGYSGSRVAQVLASTPLDRRLLVKGWTV
jgi:GDP/UDP-N,N'-diacetylbacillosamine 2-epimerase (hydrolysing)